MPNKKSNKNPNKNPDGIVAIFTIDPSDIRNVVVKDGVIVKLKMKRRGTYQGKYYSRPILKDSLE